MTQSHVMVREPAAVVTAVCVLVTVDLLGIVATLPLVLERLYVVAMETVLREGRYVSVKLDHPELIVQMLDVFLQIAQPFWYGEVIFFSKYFLSELSFNYVSIYHRGH